MPRMAHVTTQLPLRWILCFIMSAMKPQWMKLVTHPHILSRLSLCRTLQLNFLICLHGVQGDTSTWAAVRQYNEQLTLMSEPVAGLCPFHILEFYGCRRCEELNVWSCKPTPSCLQLMVGKALLLIVLLQSFFFEILFFRRVCFPSLLPVVQTLIPALQNASTSPCTCCDCRSPLVIACLNMPSY